MKKNKIFYTYKPTLSACNEMQIRPDNLLLQNKKLSIQQNFAYKVQYFPAAHKYLRYVHSYDNNVQYSVLH